LCLNYAAPTVNPGTIKSFLLAIASGLAVLSVALAWGAQSDYAADQVADRTVSTTSTPNSTAEDAPVVLPFRKAHLAPQAAAQLLTAMFLLWSLASCRWSIAPEIALGGSILLTIQWLWAFALGLGLNARAARIGADILMTATGVTSAIAVWYYYGRNPGLRAMFPLGNPLFLSACLIPGILLTATLGLSFFRSSLGSVVGRRILMGIALVALVVELWAFRLADSRGPAVGLVAGALAAIFFAVRGRWKLIPSGLAIACVLAGAWYLSAAAHAASPTGRGATLRLRGYAWSYAWRMFTEKPLTGQGQGAFVLKGDSYAVDDVWEDPPVFESRIEHAHNEWLEIMSDLGAVGIVLIGGALLITLRVGSLTLRRTAPDTRWVLIGLMGGLVGLVVSESFSVGLRVSGVSNLFYTVIGLIWATAADGSMTAFNRHRSTPFRRGTTATIGAVVGLAIVAVSYADWSAARAEYRAEVAFQQDDPAEAVDRSARSVTRLNPQRAMTSLARLSEAHLRAAQTFHHRGLDRERRAFETEPPNQRLAILALEDYVRSDEHCQAGSHALKELVSRSPGFIHHGRIEFHMNLTRARNLDAFARLNARLPGLTGATGSAEPPESTESRDRFVAAAIKAIEREMLRQPFDPSLAADYVRVAGPILEPEVLLTALARPLRYHRLSAEYAELLSAFAFDDGFLARLAPLFDQAVIALTKTAPLDAEGRPVELWAPERLRLAAALHFLRGEYDLARNAVESAVFGFDALIEVAPMAAASGYAELADARFFADPLEPAPAIDAAERALELAPRGARGGELVTGVKQRVIDYRLASGDEALALGLLKESAPSRADDAIIQRELAVRYRRLALSLLARRKRHDAPTKQLSPTDPQSSPTAKEDDGAQNEKTLLDRIDGWSKRALELAPDDPQVHRAAALVATERGDGDASLRHFRQALELGLAPADAAPLVAAAVAKFPDHQELKRLAEDVGPPAHPPAGFGLDK